MRFGVPHEDRLVQEARTGSQAHMRENFQQACRLVERLERYMCARSRDSDFVDVQSTAQQRLSEPVTIVFDALAVGSKILTQTSELPSFFLKISQSNQFF